MPSDEKPDSLKGRPLALDANAQSANRELPAFLARPDGAPVYHGFPIIDGVEVSGFRIGMITDFDASPEGGDAYVVAPDGSRAGLVWETGDDSGFQEVCPIEKDRWGVWAVWFPETMQCRDAVQRNLAHILPKLNEKWLLWKERYRGLP